MSWSKPPWRLTFSILLAWAVFFRVYLFLVSNASSSELAVSAVPAAPAFPGHRP